MGPFDLLAFNFAKFVVFFKYFIVSICLNFMNDTWHYIAGNEFTVSNYYLDY